MDIPSAARNIRVMAGGSDQVMDIVAKAIRPADSVVGEHFVFEDLKIVKAARKAAADGATGTLLGDAEMIRLGRIVPPRQFSLVPHGDETMKVHAKLTTVRDGDHAESLLSTAGFAINHRDKPSLDFLVRTDPADAAVLEELTLAGASGDRDRMQRAARAAADLGYLSNDPANGVFHLREGVGALAANATDTAYLGVKLLNNRTALNQFSHVAEGGGRVLVETTGGTRSGRAGWEQVERAADEAGLTATKLGKDDEGRKLHGNVVAAQTDEGPRMIIMTAPFTNRGLGEPGAPRMGRELGVVLDDPAHIRTVLRAMAQLDGSQAKRAIRALGV